MRYVILRRNGDNTALNERLVSENSHKLDFTDFPIKVIKEEQVSNPVIDNPIVIPTPIDTAPKKKYMLGIVGFKSLDDLNDTSKYYYIDKEANARLVEIPTKEEQYTSFNDYIAHGHKEIYLTLTDSLTNIDFNLKQFMPDLENFKFNIGLNQAQINNHGYHLYSGFYGKNSGQLSVSYENDFSWLSNEHGDRIIGLQGSSRNQWAEIRKDFYKTLSNDSIVANPAIRVTSDKVNTINLIGIKPITYKGTKLHMLEKIEELNRPQSNPTYSLVYSPHAMYGNYAVISFKGDEIWESNIDDYSPILGEIIDNTRITSEKIYGDNTFLEAEFIENIGNALITYSY